MLRDLQDRQTGQQRFTGTSGYGPCATANLNRPRVRLRLWLAMLLSVVATPGLSLAADPPATRFEFNDVEKVLLVGGTHIERDVNFGWLDLALTTALPEKRLSIRNLGWAADTVWCESRGIFDPPAEGYRRLMELAKELEPTVVILHYGHNESDRGPDGRAAFRQQLMQMIHDFQGLNARVILLSPLPQQAAAVSALRLPSPNRRNEQIAAYRDVVRDVAGELQLPYIDVFNTWLVRAHDRTGPSAWTTDGIQLTEAAYRELGQQIVAGLGAGFVPAKAQLFTGDRPPVVTNCSSSRLKPRKDGYSFELMLNQLPLGGPPQLSVHGLPAGKYQLRIDGEADVDGQALPTLTAAEWQQGVSLAVSRDQAQLDRVHARILDKNMLFFHRWRPQNVTYLFGFRKHEQGNNAVEIPQFDPLILQAEMDIWPTRLPTSRTYELVRQP